MLVYKLTNRINGKGYVGQTTQTLSDRLKAHKCLKTNKCPYLKNAIQKYGFDNFYVNVLSLASSKDELDGLEQKFIKEHDTMHPNGYNLRSGGQQGGPMSEESRKKLSESSKGRKHTQETKDKLSTLFSGSKHPMFGKHHSDETKKKLSAINRGSNNPRFGKPRTKEVKEKISIKAKARGVDGTRVAVEVCKKSIICVETNKVYGSVAEASRDLGNTGTSNICKVLKGKSKSVKGFTFKYYDTQETT